MSKGMAHGASGAPQSFRPWTRGNYETSWRHTGAAPHALTDIRYYRDLARRATMILGLAECERPTLRQLIHSLSAARGHPTVTGTPEQIAGLIEDWFLPGASDGFNVMHPVFPVQFDVLAAEVVPIPRAKGLFRTDYAGATLRKH